MGNVFGLFMSRLLATVVYCLLSFVMLHAATPRPAIDQPPHNYWQRPLTDRFTQVKGDLEAGKLTLDYTSEKGFVTSLLKALDVPVSSQMLVFSTTSLQLSLISPRNPRALYFNEDLYLGYVPGGKIEIVSIDPEVGGIFYIFNIPRDGHPPQVERATRCMNCHSGEDSRYVPGLVIKSVVPGQRGGSLTSYRQEDTGHQIPFSERFGGWYVTGKWGVTNHWGNVIGQLSPQGMATFPVEAGRNFDWRRYPVENSDPLPQLLHEHQAGFVNRIVEAGYRTRTLLHESAGKLAPVQKNELEQLAAGLTRYLLFADEAPLTAPLAGEAGYRADFQRNRKVTASGLSLKDFDLQTRLFKHRCSYMIYTPAFQNLPREMKQLVYQQMAAALSTAQPHPQYAYLSTAEKQAIHRILAETVKDLPARW